METSPASSPSSSMTRSEYLSTLPHLRRLLATLNWRPVYDIERRERESEKRTKLLEKEIEQLDQENKRLAELESKLDALLLSADSSSQAPPATGSN
jgi:hypothetical protein